MKEYNIRPVKHLCSIPGCGNRDTDLVTRSDRFGGAAFLCGECIAAAAARLAAEKERRSRKKAESAEHDKKAN